MGLSDDTALGSPVLTVIIPARNEAVRLPDQLDALAAQTSAANWELIVVDNGSTDDTAQVAAGFADRIPRLRVISETRPGICAARHAGVSAAEAPNVAFCDADDVVATTWVDAMIEGLRHSSIVTGPLELESLNDTGLRPMRGRANERAVPTFFGVFPYPRGNNLAIRRELLCRLGGFDHRFAGGEDIELGMRAWWQGLEIGLAPGAVVSYRYRTTPRALWRQGYGYGRVRPMLRDALIRHDSPAPAALGGWRSWVALIAKLPTTVTRVGRCNVAWIAGNRIGQLAGSISARRLFL